SPYTRIDPADARALHPSEGKGRNGQDKNEKVEPTLLSREAHRAYAGRHRHAPEPLARAQIVACRDGEPHDLREDEAYHEEVEALEPEDDYTHTQRHEGAEGTRDEQGRPERTAELKRQHTRRISAYAQKDGLAGAEFPHPQYDEPAHADGRPYGPEDGDLLPP